MSDVKEGFTATLAPSSGEPSIEVKNTMPGDKILEVVSKNIPGGASAFYGADEVKFALTNSLGPRPITPMRGRRR